MAITKDIAYAVQVINSKMSWRKYFRFILLVGWWSNKKALAKFYNKPCNDKKQVPDFIIKT